MVMVRHSKLYILICDVEVHLAKVLWREHICSIEERLIDQRNKRFSRVVG